MLPLNLLWPELYLLSKLDEIVYYNGKSYDLSANLWADNTVSPQGYLNIKSFHLDRTIPVWNFAFADSLLEKRIWMQQGENTTFIRYSYKRGSQPLILSLKALVNYRGYHSGTHIDNPQKKYIGEAGVQFTWMDAKVGNWVVTPCIGKPIEVNALWYNALVCMEYFAGILNKSSDKYRGLAAKTRSPFSKFWYEEGGYCYNVIDSPEGNDPSFRPNQIFAVSLPSLRGTHDSLLRPEQQKMLVDKVGGNLLTSYGLRSLSTEHPDYVGVYGGNQLQRDGSYHQCNTWGWLIGHYIQAHLQVYKNPELARSFLAPMANHLQDGCIGSISEIFDGDPPFTPRGCFAQAWSVAEVLRAWLLTLTIDH